MEEAFRLIAVMLREYAGWVGICYRVDLDPTGAKQFALTLYVDVAALQPWLGQFEITATAILRLAGFQAAFKLESIGRMIPAGGIAASGISTGTNIGNAHEGVVSFFARVDGDDWMVTANHVISGNGVYVPPLGPGNLDSAVVWVGPNRTLIGRRVTSKKIVSGQQPPPTIDAAACIVTGSLGATLYPGFPSYSPVAYPKKDVTPDAKFFCRNDRTPVTVAPHDGNEFLVSYTPFIGMGLGDDIQFQNQWLVRADQAFQPGDSGSLIVGRHQGTLKPLGMLFAMEEQNDSHYALVTPIQDIVAGLWPGKKPSEITLL